MELRYLAVHCNFQAYFEEALRQGHSQDFEKGGGGGGANNMTINHNYAEGFCKG